MKNSYFTTLLLAILLANSNVVRAQMEVSHFAPGVFGIRDFIVPEAPGLYGAIYSYNYSSSHLNNSDGNEIESVTIKPRLGPGVTLNVDVDADISGRVLKIELCH